MNKQKKIPQSTNVFFSRFAHLLNQKETSKRKFTPSLVKCAHLTLADMIKQ